MGNKELIPSMGNILGARRQIHPRGATYMITPTTHSFSILELYLLHRIKHKPPRPIGIRMLPRMGHVPMAYGHQQILDQTKRTSDPLHGFEARVMEKLNGVFNGGVSLLG